MIQRKQSLWLFLAALLNAGVFYFDLYTYHTIVNAVDTSGKLRVADHYPSVLIALVITLLPLVTIFMFRYRTRQIRMSLVSILGILVFIAIMYWRVRDLNNMAPPPVNCSYWIGAILPVAALVFLILAIIGIRRDEQLVKSADRLR
jgi:drug/metabolite transporter (DMT)-like permease